MSGTARLMYGFYLGQPCEERWAVREIGVLGDLLNEDRPWMGLNEDPRTAMRLHLLAEAGVSETVVEAAGYFRTGDLMVEYVGADIVWSGHLEYPHLSLVAPYLTMKSDGYRPTGIILDSTPSRLKLAEGRMKKALAKLGMTPTQHQAEWLLASVYS
jgi:hypothetical protein